MVSKPVAQVLQAVELVELVSAGDAQGDKAFQIVGVRLVSVFKGDDGVVVDVALLVEVTEHAPGFSVALVLLNLGFKAKDGFLHLLLLNKLLSSLHEVVVICLILVLFLELDITLDTELREVPGAHHGCLFVPDLAPLFHEVAHATLGSIEFPLLHHLLKLVSVEFVLFLFINNLTVLDLIEVLVSGQEFGLLSFDLIDLSLFDSILLNSLYLHDIELLHEIWILHQLVVLNLKCSNVQLVKELQELAVAVFCVS